MKQMNFESVSNQRKPQMKFKSVSNRRKPQMTNYMKRSVLALALEIGRAHV